MNHRWGFLKIAILLGVMGAIAYSNAVFHPFVHDDVVFIQQNPRLGDWSSPSSVFYPSFSGNVPAVINPYYRPLLEILYKFQYRLFFLNPHLYHLFNILLHITNSILLYYLFLSLTSRQTLATGTAALFLLHPVQTEAVSCIAGVSNILFVFFFLMSLILYREALLSQRWRFLSGYILSLGFFICALLTKEQAVMLPLLVLWCKLCFFKREEGSADREKFWGLRIAGFFVVAAGYFLWRKVILGSAFLPVLSYPQELFLRILAIPQTLLMYLKILLWPAGLHYYRSVNVLDFSIWPSVILAGLMGVLVFSFRRLPRLERRLMVFGLGWFLIALAPVVNIVPLIIEYSFILTSEHFLYLPLAGFGLSVLTAGEYVFSRLFKETYPWKFILGFVAFLLVSLTLRQNTYWRGEVPLFERVLRYEPQLGRVHILMARAYYFNGNLEEAVGEYTQALDIIQSYLNEVRDTASQRFYLGLKKGAHFDLAHAYEAQGKWTMAIAEYKQALAVDPQDGVVHNNIGANYLRLRDIDLAMLHFKEALLLNPQDVMAVNNLAVCFMEKGNAAQAEDLWRRILTMDPHFSLARQNLNKLLQEKVKGP